MTRNASTSGKKLPKRQLRPHWGAALDPNTAAQLLRQLRALAWGQAQELAILNKALASKRLRRVISQTETR